MRLAFCVSILTSGCNWISYEDLETAKQSADNDGDGFGFTDDCNDNDASIFPGAEEEWYTGVDQNCDGLNDYDADQDGYVPSGYEGALTDNNPATVITSGGDCNDEDAAIFPDAVEIWYDGVDQDCGEENDFDADADGHDALEHGGDDCNDIVADEDNDGIADGFPINPSATEIWYDGVDQDCGEENDFDADGDSFESIDYGGTDCNDSPIDEDNDGTADGFAINPHPDNIEVWYDGVDQNCDEKNDFDADEDGYAPVDLVIPDGLTVDDIGVPLNDCNDSDINSYFGNVEVLGDTSDRDCDGLSDSFEIVVSENIEFTDVDSTPSNPRALRIANNTGTAFVSLIAENLELNALQGGTTATYYKVGLAIEFDLATLIDGPIDIFRWQGFTTISSNAPYSYELNEGHSIAVTEDFFFGGLGLQLIDNFNSSPDNRALRIGAQNLSNSTFGNCIFYANTQVVPFEDVDLMVDSNGLLHAVGCESDSSSGYLQYMVTDAADCTDNAEPIDYDTLLPNVYASQCRFREEDPANGTLFTLFDDAVTPRNFELANTPLTLTPGSDVIDGTLLQGSPLGGWLLSSNESDGALLYHDTTTVYLQDSGVFIPILENVEPESFYATFTDNGSLLLSYINTSGDAIVAYGDPNNLATYTVNTGFVGNEIVAYTDDTTLLVTVLGSDSTGSVIAYGTAKFTE